MDPLLIKAKNGTLAAEEFEVVLSELRAVAVNLARFHVLDVPWSSQLDRLKVKLDRLKASLMEQDLEAARREMTGEVVPRKPVVRTAGRAAFDLMRDVPDDRRPAGTRDPYVLLEIVGVAGGPDLVMLVEPFLDSRQDPMLARLSLEILCNYWGLRQSYRHRLVTFLMGAPWDEEGDVRQVAISEAGEYLRRDADREILQALLGIATSPTEDKLTREIAIQALGRAIGMSHQRLPFGGDVPADSDLAQGILRRARSWLSE